MVQKIYSKMHPVLCTNTHHDVTDLVNHGMVKNTETWISWKPNIIFLRNKKIVNLYFRWHILRSYRFLAEVTFNFHLFWHLENEYSEFFSHDFSKDNTKVCFSKKNHQIIPLDIFRLSVSQADQSFALFGFDAAF